MQQKFHKNWRDFAIGKLRLSHFQFSVQFSQAVTFLPKSLLSLVNALDTTERRFANSTIFVGMLSGKVRACLSWPCYHKSDHPTHRNEFAQYTMHRIKNTYLLYFDFVKRRQKEQYNLLSLRIYVRTKSRLLPQLLHACDRWQVPTSTFEMEQLRDWTNLMLYKLT